MPTNHTDAIWCIPLPLSYCHKKLRYALDIILNMVQQTPEKKPEEERDVTEMINRCLAVEEEIHANHKHGG